jgi:sensor histidine kinase regulating citrate/malate metabolism
MELPIVLLLHFSAFADAVILYSFFNLLLQPRYRENAEQLKLFEAQIRQQYEFFEAKMQSLDDMRAIRHDMRNQLQTVSALLSKQDTAAASEYLQQFCDAAGEAEIPEFCENKVVSALMYNKYLRIKAAGIRLEHGICIPDGFFLGDVVLCSLFSNALDNAIEACSAITEVSAERVISIKTAYKGNYFILRVENTHSNRIVMQDGMPVPGAGHEHRGYGSKILASIAGRYDGSVEYKFDDNTFAVAIIIPVKESAA